MQAYCISAETTKILCLAVLQSQLYVSLDYKDNTKDYYHVCLNYMSVSTVCQSLLYVSLDEKIIDILQCISIIITVLPVCQHHL